MEIKTIDLEFKEWFDELFGNSYHSGKIILNYGTETEETYKCPMTYGYENQYIHTAFEWLRKKGVLPKVFSPGRFCKKNNIVLRTHLKRDCTEKEVKNNN